VKDLDIGLVDFPTLYRGEEVSRFHKKYAGRSESAYKPRVERRPSPIE
jgi:hypothetical protein